MTSQRRRAPRGRRRPAAVPVARRSPAPCRRRCDVLKNTGSISVEVALLAHALHQHRTDHAAPTDESDSHRAPLTRYSIVRLLPRRLDRSAATTASPIARVPTTVSPAAAMSAVRKPSPARRAHGLPRSARATLGLGRTCSGTSSRRDRIVASGFARCPCPRCRAPSRGSARRGPCRSRRATPTAACRSSRRASPPRRTGCRRTCCR